MEKLTKARLQLLKDLSEGPQTYSESYPPLKWAVGLGYAVRRVGMYSDTLNITDLGRAALAKEQRAAETEGG